MGIGASDVNWTNPPPPGRDYWGAQPLGLQPSQQIWSQLFNEGLPPFKTAIAPKVYAGMATPPYTSPWFGTGGQGSDLLQTFGPEINSAKDGGGSWLPERLMFPNANQRAWPPATGDPNVCTPENYPNCNMQIWRDQNDKRPYAYPQYWSDIVQLKTDSENWKWDTQFVGQLQNTTNLPQRWNQLLNKEVQNYLAGGLDALDYVNSQNTANFDPCDGSGFFETLVPLVAGVAAVVVPNIFGFEIFALLPRDTKAVVDVTLALVGYDAGKIAMLGVDTRAQRYKEKAATAVTIGAGVLAGEFIVANVTTDAGVATRYAILAASAFLSNRLLYEIILTSFAPAGIGLGLAGFVFRLMDSFSRFLCKLNNWGYNVCDDFKHFQDARKWDVGSIAAQITDRAADLEGWGKDDPRREFVYRGLITGPAMLGAAADNPVPGIFETHRTNPLGSWLQVHTKIDSLQTNVNRNSYGYTVTNVFDATNTSIRGTDSESGFFGTDIDHNRYACNNIDVLLKALEDDLDTDESNPQKDADRVLATRLNPEGLNNPTKGVVNWTKQLVAMARDPNNIRKQGEIPGMEGSQTPKFDYDVETYLRTCMNDFEHKAGEHYGTGFNHVKQRGQYVFAYESERAKGLRLVETSKQALLEANACFGSFDSETAALDYWQERKVKDNNIAMAVQYWHEPKGDAQRWTFDNNWRSRGDPRVERYLSMEVAAFEFPFTEPYSSTPLMPAQHTPVHGLLPAKHTPMQPLDPAQHTHARGLLPAQRTHSVHLLPTHERPLPQPPLHMKLPQEHPIQLESSQFLMGELEILLKSQGWEAVHAHFVQLGSWFPNRFQHDAYFYVCLSYSYVALQSMSPTDAVTKVFNDVFRTQEAMACQFAETLVAHAPVLYSQMTPDGQQNLQWTIQNICSR